MEKEKQTNEMQSNFTPEEDDGVKKLRYDPNKKEKDEILFVYKEFEEMRSERNNNYTQFNDRTLLQFVEDSKKRVQGYVPSRDAQGKDEWQSNVFNQATRNKLKAILASVALTPPKTPVRAKNEADGGYDIARGEYMENLVKHATSHDNKEIQIFWEGWQCATEGSVIKYIGYLKSVQKRKFIKSYNFETGEMTFDEKEVVVNDECVDFFVPLKELFIKNFYVHDIQRQSAVAWVRVVDKETAELEFGRYKNWKYVYGKGNSAIDSDLQDFFKERVESDEYEIIKYYNKSKDMYSVIINGVLILSTPLLWGMRKKSYPFAKTICEPFNGVDFFYGNSLANANSDAQDTINSLYNMGLDKTYRSLVPQRLIGNVNKDLMEAENEEYGMENDVYVSDVAQVKWLETPGLNNSEMAMIKWVGQQLDLGMVDQTQQGVAGRGVTAREIVIANENAKKLKGIFFLFLSDLWVQKTKLFITNILMHYPLARISESIGEDGAKVMQETFPTYFVNNAEFPNGDNGTLAIQFVSSKEELPTQEQLDIDEEVMKLKGMKYNKVAMVQDYFNNYEYEPEVVSDMLYQQDRAEEQATFADKLKIIMSAFPEYYENNKRTLFLDFLKAYQDKESRYNLEIPQAPAMLPDDSPMGGGNEKVVANENQMTG